MAHKITGTHSRGNPAISRSSTAITTGKYTPSTNYSGAKTESYRCPPMRTCKQPGGHSARVVKSPSRIVDRGR